MTKLSVNVNKVATLRNTRHLNIPSIVRAATLCLEAGAHGITIHPRPDQRHIRPDDVRDLASLLKKFPGAEFNIEGNPFHGYMDLIETYRPKQCTLVPDEPSAFTSNQGWNLSAATVDRLKPIIGQLKDWGCRVSLFMDANADPIPVSNLGADRIELYTEPYAADFAKRGAAAVEPFATAAEKAMAAGLKINAGHDLSLQNLPALVAGIPALSEVSIGHALIADALEFGLADTVRQYLSAIESGRTMQV
jgi:pyridoxine 5-phosphate synthase